MSRVPPAPSLRRKVAVIAPKVEIVIACEGKVTEPDYFEKCIRYYGAGLVRLRVLNTTGVPVTVVRAAIAERALLQEKARRTPAHERVPFSVWAVFDRDEHNVEAAFDLAKANKIGLAFSNPCFEIWPLLHLNLGYGSQEGRHQVQRRLSTLMPGYHHQTNARVDFDLLKDNVDGAILRAAHLNSAREAEGCSNGCPSTTVGELVSRVMDNGRVNFRGNR